MRPGVRTSDHPRVGTSWRVTAFGSSSESGKVGVCVSVTPWGNDQIRWMRLRFDDGTEKSYAPSHLWPHST